jgi:pimeloyl-ACP methyl ester carboxylesterase
MPSKRSTVSATVIRNSLPSEIYIGGAGDESSRLVLSYAELRREKMRGRRDVHYLPHWKITAAGWLARDLSAHGHPVALIGHSWGADTVLKAARVVDAALFLIGADPVAKPVSRITARDGRPPSAALVLHVDASPASYDRSDLVKAAGFLTGGGIPRAFAAADSKIDTRLNHWNFRAMMQAPGDDGQTAEDWLAMFPERLSQTAG